MRKVSFLFLITLVLFSVSVCMAQTGRTSRRVTNPAPKPTPTPKSEDLSIISTADDEPTNTTNTQPAKKTTKRNTASTSEQGYIRDSLTDLNTDVGSLSERVGQMEEKQRQLLDLNVLSQAEARAETLHQQLFDIVSKEADLKGRMAQLDYDSRPEIIERATNGYGSTRPEDLREARRIQLAAEKQRIQEQLDMISKRRVQLEMGVQNADQLVELLRKRLDDNLNNPVQKKPTRKAKQETDEENPDKPNQPIDN